MVALSGGDLHTEVIQVQSGDELEVLTQTPDSTTDWSGWPVTIPSWLTI